MLLNDRQIRDLCKDENGMLWPFEPIQKGKPSYGLGSCGYDLRLGGRALVPSLMNQYREEMRPYRGPVLDPLNFPKNQFVEIDISASDGYYDVPPNSFILAESVERFNMPDDVFAVVVGKSTYCRCGLLCNISPAENSWKGILTMELANLGHLPIRIYAGQGIAQVLFFKTERPIRTYTEKESGGIYQNQTGVTVPQ